MKDLIDAIELSLKLRTDFATLADVVGPYDAFMTFAAAVICDPGTEPDDLAAERKRVEIIRAVYDEYVATHDKTTTNSPQG